MGLVEFLFVAQLQSWHSIFAGSRSSFVVPASVESFRVGVPPVASSAPLSIVKTDTLEEYNERQKERTRGRERNGSRARDRACEQVRDCTQWTGGARASHETSPQRNVPTSPTQSIEGLTIGQAFVQVDPRRRSRPLDETQLAHPPTPVGYFCNVAPPFTGYGKLSSSGENDTGHSGNDAGSA